MKLLIKKVLPSGLRERLSIIRQSFKSPNIIQPIGDLDPFGGKRTFVMVVGPAFNQNRPDAMMTCRMGYCHAFESMGIPYILADINDVEKLATELPSPFFMYFAGDLVFLSKRNLRKICHYPSAVWVYPWFKGSDTFFSKYGLDANIWTLPKSSIEKVIELNPGFCFTATTNSGLIFFENWEKEGLPIKSLPLACDTKIYNKSNVNNVDFKQVNLAFVGGYWESKGRQIDEYLRPFENQLEVYGYNRWPYSGYKGMLPRDAEASLYRQAKVCPVINEFTVELMRGQINERVFKVLGSMGCPVVDAVSTYRELYSEDELLVSKGSKDFVELVNLLLKDNEMNQSYREKGYQATLNRHTYEHRALDYLSYLNLSMSENLF
jgi:hypothetical protein